MVTNWIPRGKLYHTIPQSLKYLIWCMFSPLKVEPVDKIKLENKFAQYLNVGHCQIFPSARIALYYSLKSLNLPPNSKILMPPITIKPMLDIIYNLGITPIFVDLNYEDFSFDLEDLKQKVDKNVKVVFLTHLFGMVPNMKKIQEIVSENSLYLIEDFSQAIGAKYEGRPLGTFGHVSIYSSSSIKTFDTLGGGYAITNNLVIASRLKEFKNELINPKRSIILKKAFSNLIRNLATNDFLFTVLTINLLRIINKNSTKRMTGTRNKIPLITLPTDWFRDYSQVQVRIALEQIEGIAAKTSARILKANEILGKDSSLLVDTVDVYWQLCITAKNINKVFESAKENKIDISQTSLSIISANEFYPDYVNCQKAEDIYANSYFVPCYPSLNSKNLKRVIQWHSKSRQL
jgi:perosamine synthetase